MANIDGLATIVSQLRSERTNLANQLRHVDAALSVLGKLDGGSNHTGANQPKRIISAASRRKMAAAQKRRWAAVKKEPQPSAGSAKPTASAPVKHKHKISAAGRKRMAAATRLRWAKFRAAKKKAA
jgi:hypothetical protein